LDANILRDLSINETRQVGLGDFILRLTPIRRNQEFIMDETGGEYEDAHFIGMEIIWGKGFMSPGGAAEVASVVDGVDVKGKIILEIGSGLGGTAIALADDQQAGRVVAIDIQKEQIEWAKKLAEDRGVADRIEFRLVDPGPFPFENASFDIVFSMGTIVQIPNKREVLSEALRVLRPGGILAGNDWLRGWTGPLSKEMIEHGEKAGLTYHWVTQEEFRETLSEVGFEDVVIRDRGAWMVDQLRNDLEALEFGAIRDQIVEAFGEGANNWSNSWKRSLLMAERGELVVAQFHASRPS
jgi:phosphoethanolamine N-methyltransferase